MDINNGKKAKKSKTNVVKHVSLQIVRQSNLGAYE